MCESDLPFAETYRSLEPDPVRLSALIASGCQNQIVEQRPVGRRSTGRQAVVQKWKWLIRLQVRPGIKHGQFRGNLGTSTALVRCFNALNFGK